MTLDTRHTLPICKISRENPERPPLSRRIKDFGMKTAGQLATVLRHLPRQPQENEFGILVYHRVAPLQPQKARPSFNVTPDCFREQITGLRSQGFTVLSLQEVLRRSATNEGVPPRTLVITFDDGFESVYEFAWPTLRELNVPATIFLNTGYLGHQTPFPFDAWGHTYEKQVAAVNYRPLTVAQCREMASSGLIELGAHTHTHADFRGRPDMFRRDMKVCLESLRDNFGITSPTFAFPFGKPSTGFTESALIEVVRGLGLRCALTTEATCARLSDTVYHWGRFNVYDWDNADTLAAKALGFYGWVPRLFERLAPFGRRRWAALIKSRQRSERSNDVRSHASSKV